MNYRLDRLRWGATAAAFVFLSPISARSEPATAPDTTGATPAAAHDGAAEQALATWKGGRITRADLEAVLALKLPQERVTIAAPGGREQLLDDLVRFDLLVEEARARGYATRPSVIDASQNEAIEAMYARDFTVAPEAITQAEVEQHWKEHGAELQRPRVRRAAVIVLATEAEANALRRVLAGADRATFAKTAVERSIDKRTSHQGGELGYFDATGTPSPAKQAPRIAKPIAEAAFALRKEGDISKKPIAVEGGYAIVMYTGEMQAIVRSLDDAAGEIREQLAGQRMLQMRDELVAKLREEYKPEVKPELVDAIVLEPPGKADIPQGVPAAPRDPREPLKQVKPDKY